jgi:16S rRNA (cytosine967-C5)-methyltransferase
VSSSSTTLSNRRAALHQLERIERDQAYVGQLDADVGGQLDARGRRQVKEYVAGITRWRRWLDFLLASFYHGDFEGMERPLQIILRIGLYDLLFLRTPTHAAVHENVELAKQEVRPGAAGLVNGILRSIDRRREALPEPHTGNPAEDLAIRQSHPTWIVRRWVDRYGLDATHELLAWNNQRPVHGLRINTLVTSVEAFQRQLDDHDIPWAASPYLDDFVRVQRLQPIIEAGWLSAGQCAVQDESAGLIGRVLDPQPGEMMIDACAAPGGKSLYAAIRMQGEGTIHAVDVNASRMELAMEAATAHGAESLIQPHVADLREWATAADAPQADRVLLDAPCSGLGVLAKRADLRWQRAPGDLDELTMLQDELLDAAARCVRPGGWLVYSTCTIEPEENQQRVMAFLDRHPDFTLESAHGVTPDEVLTDDGFLATLPHVHRIDGAFAARLRRPDAP